MSALATAIGRHPVPVYTAVLVFVLLVVAGAARYLQTPSRAAFDTRKNVLAATIVVPAVLLFGFLARGLDGTALPVRLDEAIAAALVETPSPTLDRVVASVTHLGDRATLIAIVVAVGGLLVASGRRAFALAWTLTCAGNGVLNPALKALFARARPVHDAAYATVGDSFPSGHTSGSVVVYGMLAWLASRLLREKWHLPIMLATAALVFTVGCSRIYLRVHWASDVVAGFASGAAWLTLCILIQERCRDRRRPLTPS